MRFPALPIIAAVVMLAAPALAQTASSGSSSSSSSQLPPDTAVTVDTQQKLKQSLEQNGFKDVVVVPRAYAIRAQAPGGSKIVMEVGPDQMHAIIDRPGGSSSTSGGASR